MDRFWRIDSFLNSRYLEFQRFGGKMSKTLENWWNLGEKVIVETKKKSEKSRKLKTAETSNPNISYWDCPKISRSKRAKVLKFIKQLLLA